MSRRPAAGARRSATAGVVVALDQATKQLVDASIDRGEQRERLPRASTSPTRATRAWPSARSRAAGWWSAVLIGLSLALLLGYFARATATSRWLWLPVGMLLGGALGNLADRAREGAVIDFIDPVAWPAFNVADTLHRGRRARCCSTWSRGGRDGLAST